MRYLGAQFEDRGDNIVLSHQTILHSAHSKFENVRYTPQRIVPGHLGGKGKASTNAVLTVGAILIHPE